MAPFSVIVFGVVVWTIAVSGAKQLRFRLKTDWCGRGLSLNMRKGDNGPKRFKKITILYSECFSWYRIVILNLEMTSTRKNSEFQMGFEPTTLRRVTGPCNH